MTFGIDNDPRPTGDPGPVIAAARRVDVAEIERTVAAETRAAEIAAEDLRRWDIRAAAAMNFLEIGKSHGGHQEWTTAHAAQFRALMAIGAAVAAGDPQGIVPQGFAAEGKEAEV